MIDLSCDELLRDCTVRIKTPKDQGTGFFVAPGQILTCNHVVEDTKDNEIKVFWKEKLLTIAGIARTASKNPDLALLKVTLTEHPCVYLNQEVQPNDDLYSYGYPPNSGYEGGSSVNPRCVGPADQGRLLTIKDENIRPGLSGAPLLNLRTFKVCGLIKRERSTPLIEDVQGKRVLRALGGQAIPVQVVFDCWNKLKDDHDEFHRQDTFWRSLIPKNNPGMPIIDETRPPSVESWQNRSQENEIFQWLSHKQARIIGVVAAGGYGKSSLVDHVFEQVEELQDKLWANFQESCSFNGFGLWLLAKIARDKIYQGNTDEDLATELVNRLAKGQYLLVMDNLETLVGTPSWQSYQAFFQKWLAKGRNSTILITCREHIELQFEHRCHWIELSGLSIESGITLLESLGIRGEETQLKKFVETAEGHPLLLTLAAQWIKSLEADGKKIEIHTLSENQVTLFEKIVGSHRSDPQASVGKVLSESFRRLSQPMQLLLMNLSVYRRPFSTKMAKVMTPHDVKESMIKKEFVQRSLVIQQKSNGKSLFRFQPLIKRYIQFLLKQEGDLIEAHKRAIEYYDTESRRRKYLKEEEALELFEIVYHGCEAEQTEHAARVLNDNFDWLKSRGYFDVIQNYYELVIQYLELQPLNDLFLLPKCWHHLGAAYLVQGKYQQAMDAAEKTLELSGDYQLSKASTWDRISEIRIKQGKPQLAIGFSKQALEIARQSSDLHFLSAILGNLALAYDHSKQYESAVETYEEALKICRQLKYTESESRLLKGLGNIYYRPDNPQKDFTKAIQHYEEALGIAEKFGFQHIKAGVLCDWGIIHLKQRDFLKALNNLQVARDIFGQIGDRQNEAICLRFLGATQAVHNWKIGNWNWNIESIETLLAAKKIERELGVPIDPNVDKFQGLLYRLLDSEPIRRLLDRSK